MGNINFTGTFNTTQVDAGFDHIVDSTKATTKVVSSEFKKQSKAINDEYKKVKPIPQPVDGKTLNLFQQAKKEMRQLASEAIRVQQAFEKGEASATELATAIDKAAKKKGDFKDLQSAISALDPDTKAAAFSNLAASGVESLNGIAGAFALLGVESEDYQKILVRLQGLQAIATSIRSISGLSDQWNEAKLVLNSYVAKLQEKILADKVNKALTAQGAAAQLATSNAVKAQTAAMGEATIATKLWNIVLNSNPFILLATAILAVVAVVATYTISTNKSKAAELERSKAIDGTIIKNKELRDAYNDSIFALREMQIEYDLLTKSITEYDAAIGKLAIENDKALTKIQSDTKEKLAGVSTEFATQSRAQLDERLKYYKQFYGIESDYYKELAAILEENDTKTNIQKADNEAKSNIEQEKRNQTKLENERELEVELLKTKKAILEAGGKDTYEIQRAIIIQEQALADEKVKSSADADGERALNAQKAAQAMLAIDKAEADARRQFRQQLNGLIISQMSDGHQKELSLLEENYRAQNETRSEFFNRENGTLKAKYEKDLATLNESLRVQRETILNDVNYNGAQKSKLIDELEGSINKQRIDLETKFQEEKLIVEKNYDKRRFEDSQKNLDAIAEAKRNNIQFEVDMIDAQGEIENAELKKQLNKKLISQADYDKQVAKNELESIIRRRDAVLKQDQLDFDRLQKKLRTEQALGIDNEETVKELDAAKKKLKLDGLKFDGEIANKSVEVEKDAIEARKELLETAKQNFEIIKNAADEIIEKQQDSLDRAKEINDAAIAENDRYLGVLTENLKAELEAKEDGYANNFKKIQEQIEAEKEARRQNLEDQKEIQAQQDRLNKIKLIADKAQQASALITAAANIIKGWSSLPIIGQVLGVAAIGAMLASFLSFSNKAKAAPGFAKGTKKAPAGLKWVGEQGPELIDDKGGYRIFTNKESENIVNNYQSFSTKIPKYDFTSHISRALQPSVTTDTKGIERGIKKTNSLLEQGINEPKIIYTGNKKIVSKGGSTTITTELNGRR